MSDEDLFNKIISVAVENKTDEPPENPEEFDVYADNNYNLYMFIKGEWKNIGLNVTPI